MSLSDTIALQAENRRLEAEIAALRLQLGEAATLHSVEQQQYRNLLGAMDSGFCVVQLKFGDQGQALDYRFLETNPAFEQHTGLHGAAGRWMRELVPQHEQHWFDRYGQIAQTGEARRFVDHAHALNRWYEVHAARVGAASAQQVAILFTDITARRLAEEALRLSDRLLAFDEPGAMAYEASRTVGQLLGAERAGYCSVAAGSGQVVVSDDWYATGLGSLAGEPARHAFEHLRPALLGGAPVIVGDVGQAMPIGAAEQLLAYGIAAFASFPLVEGQRTVALMYLASQYPRDWSLDQLQFVREVASRTRNAMERRRAEQQLRALNNTLEAQVQARSAELLRSEELLRQSQKMEAVGQLTGGIAHDFNNLLTGISGSIELLKARLAQGRFNDLARYLEAAEGASRRAAALTHRLLAFSRQQALAAQPTDVNQLVAGMQELIGRTMGPPVTVQVLAEAALWVTEVDPPQLENALLNLCINARDAMPEGGQVSIRTFNRTLAPAAAVALQVPAGQYVGLEVADTGSGMPPHVLAKAFDPFFTTKPLGMGTGLGLSMIYGFARQSGGLATLDSEPGQGTRVTLLLPRCLGEVQRPEPVLASTRAPRSVGRTVLVVDDEATVRAVVVELLSELGYAVLEAADGASALPALESNLPIDLLLSDIGLPGGLDGRQLAERARVLRPTLKVLFITGYAEQATLASLPLADGMYLLTKPFAVEGLGQRVRQLLEGDAPPAA